MIISKLDNGNELSCRSNYDSGTHLGFSISLREEGEYTGKSLDKVLTKDQIKGLEAMLLAYTLMYIEDNSKIILVKR